MFTLRNTTSSTRKAIVVGSFASLALFVPIAASAQEATTTTAPAAADAAATTAPPVAGEAPAQDAPADTAAAEEPAADTPVGGVSAGTGGSQSDNSEWGIRIGAVVASAGLFALAHRRRIQANKK